MKKAVTIWALSEGTHGNVPLIYACRLVKSFGFDALEASYCKNGEISPSTPLHAYQALSKQLRESGCTISSLSTLLLNEVSIISDEKEERKQAMDICQKMIEAAALLHIPTISISPGRVQAGGNYIDYYQKSLEQISILLEYAHSHHIMLCIENVWQGLLLSPLEMLNYVNTLNHPDLGVCLDLGNTLLNSFPQHWLRTLGTKIKKIHMTDLKIRRNSIYEFKDPGQGDIDWNDTLSSINAIPYDQYLTIEAFAKNKITDEERIRTLSSCFDDIIGPHPDLSA